MQKFCLHSLMKVKVEAHKDLFVKAPLVPKDFIAGEIKSLQESTCAQRKPPPVSATTTPIVEDKNSPIILLSLLGVQELSLLQQKKTNIKFS